MVLRQLAGTFLYFEGKARNSVENGNRSLTQYCKFLANSCSLNKLTTISDLTTEDLYEYLTYLKRTSPTYHKNGKTQNPWFEKWKFFGRILSQNLDISLFPYCQTPDKNKTDGHTPYAMGMFLDVLRREIDEMRKKIVTLPDGNKITRWQLAAEKGRILTIDWFKQMKPGRSSSYTKQQLDEFEGVILNDLRARESYREIARNYNVPELTVHAWRKKYELGLWLDKPLQRNMSSEDFEVLKKELGGLPIVADALSANKIGLATKAYRNLRLSWRKNGRPKERFNADEEIDITIEDIIATIHYYLPVWPLGGAICSKKRPHRVYQSANGIFLRSFERRSEALAFAKEHDAVTVFDFNSLADSRANPGELVMQHLKTANGGSSASALSIKIGKLIPGGLRRLVQGYLPTSYEWGVVLLYWLCMSGWNLEAVRSIKYRDLLKQLKGDGPYDLLSKDHTMIVSQTKVEDDILPMVEGIKTRGQPEDKPKFYTHISDRTEKYGLFRVLEDYCELTALIRQHLDEGDKDYVFVGVSATHSTTVLSEQCYAKTRSFERQFKIFLDKNPIYEDEKHIKRISITGSRRIRVTCFTTLKSLGIPITTLAFIGGHEVVETTLIHYSSGKNTIAINREQSRVLLNVIAAKAFQGTLKRYTQREQNQGKKTIQIFTHRNTDIMLCADRYNPTWADNEKFLPRQASGKTTAACEQFEQCLFCKQCVITKNTLPYLVRWFHDLREWRRKQGGGDFPNFMFRRYQAIQEIFELCENNDGDYWQQALRRAEDIAMGNSFCAPPLWRSL